MSTPANQKKLWKNIDWKNADEKKAFFNKYFEKDKLVNDIRVTERNDIKEDIIRFVEYGKKNENGKERDITMTDVIDFVKSL